MCLFEANYECVVAEVEPEFTHNADSADISTSVFFFFPGGIVSLSYPTRTNLASVKWAGKLVIICYFKSLIILPMMP